MVREAGEGRKETEEKMRRGEEDSPLTSMGQETVG